MRILLLVISVFVISLSVPAQTNDTVRVSTSHSPTLISDTIQAKDLIHTAQSEELLEAYLLQLLEQQGQQLNRDSLPHPITVDTTQLKTPVPHPVAHPLCMELVLRPLKGEIKRPAPYTLHATPGVLHTTSYSPHSLFEEEKQLDDLRDGALRHLTGHAAEIYCGTFLDLPQLDKLHKQGIIHQNPKRFRLNKEVKPRTKTLEVEQIKRAKWFYRGSAILQFSQNFVSKNWYKGGNSNVAILGIAEGSIKYDNHSNIQWENSGEWRAGFNSVSGDTLRKISTNDDLLRLQSKLGLKAFNKFYYSASVEFQTQFFHTFDAINSPTLKTTTFSPVRFNINLGLDYKPHKGVSIMLAPISYKFIYVMDTSRIDQTQFGVKPERKSLNEIGSSLTVTYHYRPIDGLELDSRFYFYTNYQKVEMELELVANFIINRYFSARLSLYPRYDNTAILPDKEKAQLQFKEFLSVGFSHKFKYASHKRAGKEK